MNLLHSRTSDVLNLTDIEQMKPNTKILAVAMMIAAAYNTSVKSENVELMQAAKYALADMQGEL